MWQRHPSDSEDQRKADKTAEDQDARLLGRFPSLSEPVELSPVPPGFTREGWQRFCADGGAWKDAYQG